METRKPNKGGRPALADPAKHRHVLYLNDRENARFLSQWEQSGVPVHRRPAVRRAVPGSESGQVGGRVLRPADRILCTIQSRGGQLQPSGKGVAQQFYGEKGTGFSL